MNIKLFTFVSILVLLVSSSTLAAEEKGILDTLLPGKKNCNYVDKKLYQPFSDIDRTFPGADTIGLKTLSNGVSCVDVGGKGTENLVKIFFNVAISIIILLTVGSISVAGIQYMTEQATGQVGGGAKKRLTNSLVALGLGLLSYTILYTVNRQLVEFSFEPKKLDTTGAIDRGAAAAIAAQTATSSGLTFSSIEALMAPTRYVLPPGYDLSNIPTDNYGNPLLDVLGGGGSAEAPTNISPVNLNGGFGTISCTNGRCASRKPTVFGYNDGDGTVSGGSDNGVGDGRFSDKPGCTYDNWNQVSRGVALPLGFWTSVGIPINTVKYVGISVYVNDQFQAVLPVVDRSTQNFDFTFAAAKSIIDPNLKSSNSLNTAGKLITFQVIQDYYKNNPKQSLKYIIDDANTLTGKDDGYKRKDIRPCNK